jgi:hypothetical protein
MVFATPPPPRTPGEAPAMGLAAAGLARIAAARPARPPGLTAVA